MQLNTLRSFQAVFIRTIKMKKKTNAVLAAFLLIMKIRRRRLLKNENVVFGAIYI